MAYSFGLTLYNLAQRGLAPEAVDRPARPDQPVIWLHAPAADSARAALSLARRLVRSLGVSVVLTGIAAVPAEPGLVGTAAPSDRTAQARSFLDHWRPLAAVFFEGELRPTLVHEARERGVFLLLVDGRAPSLPRGSGGWWPGLLRGALSAFSLILAVDEAAARAFRRSGAAAETVEPAGRMELPSAALPCNEAERAELAEMLHSRPVWLAVGLPEIEEAAVIAAHRAVLRLSHRLLLILVPEDPARSGALAARMESVEGWAVARRAVDEPPEDDVQVYLADSTAENGLWFRLAPITFLGGSLAGNGCAVDPLQPAALGSAIIHGPRGGHHGAVIGRLASAQAALLVGSAADLAEAVSELLAPDRTARAAAAAWAVASEGLDLSDRVVAVLRDAVSAGMPS